MNLTGKAADIAIPYADLDASDQGHRDRDAFRAWVTLRLHVESGSAEYSHAPPCEQDFCHLGLEPGGDQCDTEQKCINADWYWAQNEGRHVPWEQEVCICAAHPADAILLAARKLEEDR